MSEPGSRKTLDCLPAASAAPRRGGRLWQGLAVPLVGISLLLHIVVLFVPIPNHERDLAPPEEEEAPPKDEAAVDILSISDLPVPAEPPAEVPPAEPLQPEPPVHAPPVPPANLEQVPEPTQVETAEPSIDEVLPASTTPNDGETPQFNLARQSALLGQTDGINVEFDGTADFPQNIWELGYLQHLNLNCFFEQIGPNSYQLPPLAKQLKFFRRNYGLVVQEDLPLTFSNQTLIEDPNGYCGEQFFEVQENGVPTLYVSAIRIGPGSPPASILLIFWTDDPRL